VMGHTREEDLEKFLLDPSGMTPQNTEIIKAHLAECPTCRTVLEFLRDFHARFESTGKSLPARVAAFVDSIAPPANLILLRPFGYKPQPLTGDARYTTVLAAVTDSTLSQRYRVLATFAAEEQATIVRIVLDQTVRTITTYVQTGVLEKRAFAIVSLPDLALDFVCDKNGEVETVPPPSMLSADLGSTAAVLRTWVHCLDFLADEFVTEPGPGRSCERHVGEEVFRLAWDNSELSIEPRGPVSRPYMFALVQPDDAAHIFIRLTGGGGRSSLQSLPARLTVRLYQ
jgi:hypothetical protein